MELYLFQGYHLILKNTSQYFTILSHHLKMSIDIRGDGYNMKTFKTTQ